MLNEPAPLFSDTFPVKVGKHILSMEMSKEIDNLFSIDNFPQWDTPTIHTTSGNEDITSSTVTTKFDREFSIDSLSILGKFRANTLADISLKYTITNKTENVENLFPQNLYCNISLKKNGAVFGWRISEVNIKQDLPDLNLAVVLKSNYSELGSRTYEAQLTPLLESIPSSENTEVIKVPKQVAHKIALDTIKQLVYQLQNGHENSDYKAQIVQAFTDLLKISSDQ